MARLEDGDQRPTGAVRGELFEVKLTRLLEVGDGLVDSLSLADRGNFRAIGNLQIAFFMQNRGECADRHFPPTPSA
jgi:hypothetical protein